MDLNLDGEECISVQRKYNKLFIKRDKLEQVKKSLESKIDQLMREKKSKETFIELFMESKLYVEKLQNELAETNRKNRLLEEFIEKSQINQEKCANDQSKIEIISKVNGIKLTGDIEKPIELVRK